jgi:hypothetical protein
MNIADGSLEESRYYLILAQDLGYGDTSRLTKDCVHNEARTESDLQRKCDQPV